MTSGRAGADAVLREKLKQAIWTAMSEKLVRLVKADENQVLDRMRQILTTAAFDATWPIIAAARAEAPEREQERP